MLFRVFNVFEKCTLNGSFTNHYRAAEEDVKKLHERVGKVVDASHSDAELTPADARARAATRIQAHYRGHVVRRAMKSYRIGGQLSEVLHHYSSPLSR